MYSDLPDSHKIIDLHVGALLTGYYLSDVCQKSDFGHCQVQREHQRNIASVVLASSSFVSVTWLPNQICSPCSITHIYPPLRLLTLHEDNKHSRSSEGGRDSEGGRGIERHRANKIIKRLEQGEKG